MLKSYFVDLEENTAERLDISVDELVAVSEDEIFVIDLASVYRVTDLFKRYSWTKIADIKDHWVSSDETASSALFSDGKIIVGAVEVVYCFAIKIRLCPRIIRVRIAK